MIAEDGCIYEREHILLHFKTCKPFLRSPITNQPMGARLLASRHVKNVIEKAIRNKDIVGELAKNWWLKRLTKKGKSG